MSESRREDQSIVVLQDYDQPELWMWVHRVGDATTDCCDASFKTHKEAVREAIKRFRRLVESVDDETVSLIVEP